MYGEGAKAPRTPHTQPDSPTRHIWPCPGCHEQFDVWDLADPANRRRAEEGDLWHEKCAEQFADEYRTQTGHDL